MRKILVMIFLAMPGFAVADTLVNVESAVHTSSSGKLIMIYSDGSGDQANGKSFSVDDSHSLIPISNSLCDLSKPWATHTEGDKLVVTCIAK